MSSGIEHVSLPDLNVPAVGDVEEAEDGSTQFLVPDLNEPAQSRENGEQQQQQNQSSTHHQTRTRLSQTKRMEILLWLMDRANEGKLKRGAITQASHEFHLSTRCISKLWNKAKRQRLAGERYNLSTNMHNCGRKRIQVDPQQITTLQMGDRSCIRDLATKLNVSKTTVHRMIKRGLIKPHTNPLHPGLKEANMKTRLAWVLSLLHGDTPTNKHTYHSMYDFVHLDEKWFYQSKKTQRVYLAQGEKGKYRSAISNIKYIVLIHIFIML